MIENFEQLRTSASYDRVLELEAIITRNPCEQFRKDNIVCPPQFAKVIATVRPMKNLDHTLSSTLPKVHFTGER